MQILEFRQIQSRVLLTSDGGIPDPDGPFESEEQDAALERISHAWSFVERCPLNTGTLPARSRCTSTESWIGFKRWYLSHHLFITLLALTANCLREATASLSLERAKEFAILACRLRKACGALFLYGIDFEPCAAIYGSTIRCDMPPAFSGYWIRERQHYLQPALARFNRRFHGSWDDAVVATIHEAWEAADACYHELHKRSMVLAVPDGESLARIYREEHGKPHKISDDEFREYDDWFCIERSPNVSQLDYILQACDLIERVVADLMVGHRLDSTTVSILLEGMRAAMSVFGCWVGPIPERSKFYPTVWRGE